MLNLDFFKKNKKNLKKPLDKIETLWYSNKADREAGSTGL